MCSIVWESPLSPWAERPKLPHSDHHHTHSSWRGIPAGKDVRQITSTHVPPAACRQGASAQYGLPCQEAGGAPHGKRLELRWVPVQVLGGFRELRAKRCCPSTPPPLWFLSHLPQSGDLESTDGPVRVHARRFAMGDVNISRWGIWVPNAI
jgi:hypothetical protein